MRFLYVVNIFINVYKENILEEIRLAVGPFLQHFKEVGG